MIKTYFIATQYVEKFDIDKNLMMVWTVVNF